MIRDYRGVPLVEVPRQRRTIRLVEYSTERSNISNSFDTIIYNTYAVFRSKGDYVLVTEVKKLNGGKTILGRVFINGVPCPMISSKERKETLIEMIKNPLYDKQKNVYSPVYVEHNLNKAMDLLGDAIDVVLADSFFRLR